MSAVASPAGRAPTGPLRRRAVHLYFCLSAGLLVSTMQGAAAQVQAQTATRRADVIVLVNQASGLYTDFTRYIQPYLDNFGVPYTTVDVSSAPVPGNLADYALILVGHNDLDPNHAYIDASEESLITAAVSQGTGLLNFDNHIASGGTGRYGFVQDVFGFSYNTAAASSTVTINSAAQTGGYIVGMQPGDASYNLLASITPRGLSFSAPAEAVATLSNSPLIVATTYGAGRAVQWTSYDWVNTNVWGPVHGLDDLVWRSIVWAARKPFVMQGLPNFVAFRVDDSTGPYAWADTAANQGFKIWNGYFLNDQDAQDAADMRRLAQQGSMTSAVHSRTDSTWFYYDHPNTQNFSTAQLDKNFADATAFHQNNNIPISKFVLGHYYDLGSNVFSYLQNWGVEFVGTPIVPGTKYYGHTELLKGPYCKYQFFCTPDNAPFYYADFISVPNHPEFEGQFFNVITEIRDDNGYEWHPTNDVAATINHGVAQLTRAFNGMNLATLFTHEYYIQAITPQNWSAILSGVKAGVSSYQPRYVTMDYAAQYVRAMNTSNIASSLYDPNTGNVQTTLSGKADLDTQFYLFTGQDNAIQSTLVDVPAFNGSVSVDYNPGNPPVPTATSTAQPGAPTATFTPVSASTSTPTRTPTSLPAATATPSTGSSITINLWTDANQSPVLATTTDANQLNATDNQWTEFLWTQRGYPGIFAGVSETPPLMHFFASVPNGTYALVANLYRNSDLRYYWGTTADNPQQFSSDVVSGPIGDFTAQTLGTITVNNGTFDLYVQRASVINSTGYPFWGWSWVKLTLQAGAPTATQTAMPAPTSTPPSPATATPTNTPIPATSTATSVASTPSATPTQTPTPVQVEVATLTPIPSRTPTATFTPAPTKTASPTALPTNTPKPTRTPAPTKTPRR